MFYSLYRCKINTVRVHRHHRVSFFPQCGLCKFEIDMHQKSGSIIVQIGFPSGTSGTVPGIRGITSIVFVRSRFFSPSFLSHLLYPVLSRHRSFSHALACFSFTVYSQLPSRYLTLLATLVAHLIRLLSLLSVSKSGFPNLLLSNSLSFSLLIGCLTTDH